jgi:Zn-dependent protease with chaperone function
MSWDLVVVSLAWELAVGGVLVGAALLAVWLGLRAVTRRVRSGQYTGRVGFHRFRIARAQAGALLMLALILLVVRLVPFLPAPESALPVPVQVGIAAFSIVVALALYSLLAAWLLTPRAWARTRHDPFNAPAYVAYIGRLLILSYVPALVLIEAVALLYTLDLAPYRWFLPLVVVLWAGLIAPFGQRIRAWLTGAKPIEQTPWADLAPRINAWAKLAGVELHDLRVDGIEDGNTDNAVLAGPRRHTLFLGAELLANADWRQRDAVIGHELGHARLRHLPVNAAMEALRTALAAALLMAAIDPGFLSALFPTFGSGDAQTGLFAPLSSLLVFSIAVIVLVVSAADRARRHRAELACDRFSANLTGDPLAMAVALHTIISLIGYPLRQRSRTHPTFDQRQQALMQLLHLPGPRVPWAYAPVPSAVPFFAPPFSYTVPLDQAPPPAPVQVPPFVMPAFAPPPFAPPPMYPVPYPGYPANPLPAPYPYPPAPPAGIYPPVPPYVPAPVYGGPLMYPGQGLPPYPGVPPYAPAPGYAGMAPYPPYPPYSPASPYAALTPYYALPPHAAGVPPAAPTTAPAPASPDTPPAPNTPQ